MDLGALKKKLIRELQASLAKTAILGVLLIGGMVMWLPQLVRAMTGGGKSAKATAAAVTPAKSPAGAATPAAPPAEVVPAHKEFSWEEGDKLLKSDPLVRSVELSAVQGDPFRIDRNQFPPPILFEDEPVKVAANTPESTPVVKPVTVPEINPATRLTLKSTIIGVKRRAALINDQLYYEGRELRVEGQKYTLTSVHPRKVVLTQGEASFELVIPNVYESDDSESATLNSKTGVQ